MVDDPACTTLWEGWGIGGAGFGGGTINHGWSGGPLTLMSQYFAGVAPTTPGYTTFHVLPQPGHLRRIEARVPSVRGPIEVKLECTGSTSTLRVTVPERTRAVLGLPLTGEEPLQVVRSGAQVIWARDRASGPRAPAGMTVHGLQGDAVRHFTVEVGPGEWELTGETGR